MPKCHDKDCPLWVQGRDEDDCDDCVDGRSIDVVCEYASTCDDCGELTSHKEMIMDEETHFGYCETCAKKLGLL